MDRLHTFREAARVFEVEERVIRALVRAHRIETKDVPRCGQARGLDDADMGTLARALNRQAPVTAGAPDNLNCFP